MSPNLRKGSYYYVKDILKMPKMTKNNMPISTTKIDVIKVADVSDYI